MRYSLKNKRELKPLGRFREAPPTPQAHRLNPAHRLGHLY